MYIYIYIYIYTSEVSPPTYILYLYYYYIVLPSILFYSLLYLRIESFGFTPTRCLERVDIADKVF